MTWLGSTTSACAVTGESQVSVNRTTLPPLFPQELGHRHLVLLIAAVVEDDKDVTAGQRRQRCRAFHITVRQKHDVLTQLHEVQAEILREEMGEAAPGEDDPPFGVRQ